MSSERPATEAIDRLYLELSQFTRATTEKEMRMIEKSAELRDTCCKMAAELAELRQQLAAATARLAASERFLGRRTNSIWEVSDFGVPYYTQVWPPYVKEDRQWHARQVCKESHNIMAKINADTLGELVLAMEAANWLPAEQQQQGGG